MKEIIKNIKARFLAKRFDVDWWRIDKNRKNLSIGCGYFIYDNTIYFGNRWNVFFKSGFNENKEKYDNLHGHNT